MGLVLVLGFSFSPCTSGQTENPVHFSPYEPIYFRNVLDRTIILADEFEILKRKMQLTLDKVPSPASLRYVIAVGPIRGGRAADADVEVALMQIHRLTV